MLGANNTIDIDEAINLAYSLGLTDELLDSERFEKLSGGERKKVYLVITLTKKSSVLFLDEPTNSLDLDCKEKICNYIKNINKTIITISHDKDIITLCNRIIEIKDKRIFSKRTGFGNHSELDLKI